VRAADVATVQRALQALPEPFRESLILREIEGLSYREVAEMTGVPQGTVMSRLARGRELLARKLRANGARDVGGFAMSDCDTNRLLLQALMDGELDAAGVLRVEEHLKTCAAAPRHWRT
jgi:predicted DNA-binding protein (UPF0251 family)